MRSKRQAAILEKCDQYMGRNATSPVTPSEVKRWLSREFDKKTDRYNKEHEENTTSQKADNSETLSDKEEAQE